VDISVADKALTYIQKTIQIIFILQKSEFLTPDDESPVQNDLTFKNTFHHLVIIL